MKNILSVVAGLMLIITASCADGGVSVIKNVVTEIPDGKYKSKKLASFTIPDSVTKIGNSAFASNELTSIFIPDSVTEIGNWAFSSNKITNLIIPDSVMKIDDRAFTNNPLRSVTLTLNEKTSVAENAFGNNINFNRFFLANSRQPGIYSWQDNNYYYNGEIIPYSAVVAYEQGELQKAREITELARAQERVRVEKDRRENAFVQVFRVVDNNNNYSLKRGIHVRAIDGDNRLYNTNYYVHTNSSLELDQAGYSYNWYRLSPGLHSLEVEYKSTDYSGYSFVTSSGVISTTNGTGTITLYFEAGKVYKLNATEKSESEGKVTVQFNLVETTVPIGAIR